MNKIVNVLIMAGILITPILNSGEVYALMTGLLKDQTTVYSNIIVKALKDAIFISLIFVLFVRLLIKKLSLSTVMVTYFLMLFLFLFPFLFSLDADRLQLISGVRWSVPIILILLLYLNKDFLYVINVNTIKNLLLFVFFIHFSLQTVQFFSGIEWFGILFGQFSLRNPGIFLIPNTGAFFSIIVLYLVLFYSNTLRVKDYFLVFVISFSVLLTNSGTGIAIMLFLLFFKMLPNKLIIFSPILLIFLIFTGLNLVTTVRGEDYISVSGLTRVNIFLEQLKNANIISTEMGQYTNTYMLINPDKGYIIDSTYASMLGNLGLLPSLFAVFVVFLLTIKSFFRLDRKKLSLMIIIILFSATTIINEAYPMNLLVAILIAREFFQYEHSLQRA